MNRWMVFHDSWSNQPSGYFYGPEGINRFIGETTNISLPASFNGVWMWKKVLLRNKKEPPYHWQFAGWLYTTYGGSQEFLNNWWSQAVEVSFQ